MQHHTRNELLDPSLVSQFSEIGITTLNLRIPTKSKHIDKSDWTNNKKVSSGRVKNNIVSETRCNFLTRRFESCKVIC